MKQDLDFYTPYFLGPAAENSELLESLVVEFLSDHAFWRRNFHPEDGQRIQPRARHDPAALEFQSRMRAELYQLLVPEDDVREADHFFLFRHTLMNPWLLAGPDEINYIDRYWEYLEQFVDDVLGEPDDWQFPSGGS